MKKIPTICFPKILSWCLRYILIILNFTLTVKNLGWKHHVAKFSWFSVDVWYTMNVRLVPEWCLCPTGNLGVRQSLQFNETLPIPDVVDNGLSQNWRCRTFTNNRKFALSNSSSLPVDFSLSVIVDWKLNNFKFSLKNWHAW